MEIRLSNPEEIKQHIARCSAISSCFLDDLIKDRGTVFKSFETIEQTQQYVLQKRRESEIAYEQAKRNLSEDSDPSVLYPYKRQMEKCEENLQVCDQLHAEMIRIQREYHSLEQRCNSLTETCKQFAQKTRRLLDKIIETK